MTFYELFIEGSNLKIELSGMQNIVNALKILDLHFKNTNSNQVASTFENYKVPGELIKKIIQSSEGEARVTTSKYQHTVYKCKDVQNLIEVGTEYDLVMYDV